jgi:hypothetical protein
MVVFIVRSILEYDRNKAVCGNERGGPASGTESGEEAVVAVPSSVTKFFLLVFGITPLADDVAAMAAAMLLLLIVLL